MKKHRLLLFLTALLTVFSLMLTACGQEPGAEATPNTQPTPTAAQTPAASVEPTPTVQPTLPQGECYTLNANGRQLTLVLEAEKVPDRNYYRVDAIRVYDGDRLLSTTETAGLTYEGPRLFEGVFFLRGESAFWDPIVDDFNFDGCDDLCLMASDGAPRNIPFAYFLWNEAQQRLDFSFVLSNPLEVDDQNRCLIECIVGEAGLYEQRHTYGFDEQGGLTMTNTTMIYHGPLHSKVAVYIPADPVVRAPMEHLTQEQKDLLADLPVDELPRQAADLWTLRRSQVWQQTLIPFSHNAQYDVTLYGVVTADSNFFRGTDMIRESDADGIVLRVGDRAVYAPMPWWDNAYNRYNPWMEVGDFDSDGQPEAAVCTHYSRGTGVSMEALYLFDLDTLEWTVPNFTTLDIDVEYNREDHSAVLTAGDCFTVVALQSHQIPPFHCGNQVSYSCENGQLLCTIGLESRAYGLGAGAVVVAPIVWEYGICCLGEVISLTGG